MGSLETVTPQRSTAATRLGSVIVVICFLVVAAALTRPRFPFRLAGYEAGGTIYPWWIWVLVLAGLVAGALSGVSRRQAPQLPSIASAAALVAAAQITGLGIVALKHWRPAFGMGGGYGDLTRLQHLAVVIAVAGAVAGLVLLWQLGPAAVRSTGAAPRSVRTVCLVVGVLVVALVPFAVMAGDRDMMDAHSWGAVGLIYAGPWGLSIVLAGYLPRPASLAMLLAVLVSIGLAVIGPQMIDLIYHSPRPAFAVTLLAPLIPIGVWLTHPGRQFPGKEPALR